MTDQELKAILHYLGLTVPEKERQDIAKVMPLIEKIKTSIRKERPLTAEPAFTFSLPGK